MLDRELVLPHLLAARAAKFGDRPLLQQIGGPTLTYAETHESALTWADALRRQGVGAGDNVATMFPSSVTAYQAWLGISWLRAIEAPINWMYRGAMLRYILAHSEARIAVIAERFVPLVAEIAADLPDLQTLVVPDASGELPALPFRVVRGDEFFAGAQPAYDLPGPAHHDIACMIYTSGTTGPSKGVLMPWASLYEFVHAVPPEHFTEEGGYYATLPVFHASGKTGIYSAALATTRQVFREMFSVSEFWNDIREFDCTSAGLVGTMASMLLSMPEQPDDADNPLRSVMMGPLIPELDDFKRRFGLQVTTGYGMTEIAVPLAFTTYDVPDWHSCGRLRPGYDVRIVDEIDEEVPVGQVGELIVRTDSPWMLNAGYYRMPEQTAIAWRNGWFHTGDAFRRDADGNYYYVDRTKDSIRRRGENISSFEVEALVSGHPDVQESAAIAVPSELAEDEVMVFVVPRPESGLTGQRLVEELATTMPKFMVPRYVELVDALPKTQTFRVRKVELRERGVGPATWDREKAGTESR